LFAIPCPSGFGWFVPYPGLSNWRPPPHSDLKKGCLQHASERHGKKQESPFYVEKFDSEDFDMASTQEEQKKLLIGWATTNGKNLIIINATALVNPTDPVQSDRLTSSGHLLWLTTTQYIWSQRMASSEGQNGRGCCLW
jgi:hypothetical protein